MANPSPLGVLLKNCAISRQTFTSTFLQAAVVGPILGIDFLRKFKVIVSPELSQIQFACSAAAPSAHIVPSAAPHASYCLSSSTPVPAPVPIQPHTVTTSSQPPSLSAYLVRNPEVKSSSFSFRENKSLSDPPPIFQISQIPCLMMSKYFCKNFSLFCAPGM
jgi:hypothetical protein